MLRFLWHARWVFDAGLDQFEGQESKALVGWMPHMLIFSLLTLAMFVCLALKIRFDVILLVMSGIDLVVTWKFVRTAFRRMFRLGLMGPLRARWWFELAALNWTLVCCSGLFAIAHSLPKAIMPPWQAALVQLAFDCSNGLLVSFFVFSITGYVTGLVQGRRIRGRAIELVNFFFWTFAVLGMGSLIPLNAIIANLIGLIFGFIAIGAGAIAAILGIRQHLSGKNRATTSAEDSQYMG